MLCPPLPIVTCSKFQYELYEPIYSGPAKLPMKNDSSSRINLHHPFVLKCQEIWKLILCTLSCSFLSTSCLPRCFHFLTIMNNISVNIHVKFLCRLSVFMSVGYIPRSRFAGSWGKSVFDSLRNCQTVSKAAMPFYVPTSNVWMFLFLHIIYLFYCPSFCL